MNRIVLSSLSETDHTIGTRHFGGNIIGTIHTDSGVPHQHFRDAVDELDISDLRYPAGQPDVVYARGLLIDGRIPDHVISFLESVSDREGQVLMVLPTFSSYTDPSDISEFAFQVLQEFGEKVRGFEVGNEYWQKQTEMEYGRIVEEVVPAIHQAIEELQSPARIYVQTANAAGASSAFKEDSTRNWHERTIEANKAIIDQLSEETIARIDSIVEHIYLRDEGQFLGDEFESTNMAWLDKKVWVEYAGFSGDFTASEWNIRTTNEAQLGVRAGSSLVHHFENIVRLGVSEMHVWSPQHNSVSDLAGENQVLVDTHTGIVKNTVTGAAFDLMSSSLVGKQLLDNESTLVSDEINLHAYADDHELTVYIASRSNDVEAVEFSLEELLPFAEMTSAILLGYDVSEDSSDGIHWSPNEQRFVESEFVTIDAQRYYLNEHDAIARVVELPTSDEASYSFDLLPYELVQLTYRLPTLVLGSADDDNDVVLNAVDDLIQLGRENDTLNSGGGNDTIIAGDGDDHIVLGAGADLGVGEEGNDYLSGWGGNDTLLGGDGDDSLSGFEGADEIDGGNGNDVMVGGAGDDLLKARAGVDTVRGGLGDDVIFGDHGDDDLTGEDGNDTVHGGEGSDRIVGLGGLDILLGGEGDDFVFGGSERDTLIGDGGNDTLLGGEDNDNIAGDGGSDRLLGGTGDDSLHGGEGTDVIFGGSGGDLIEGGEGNDILFGGDGSDEFVFSQFHGQDTIADFSSSDDQISISGSYEIRPRSFQELINAARQIGNDVIIETGPRSSIRLKETSLSDLEEEDFLW